MKVARTSTVWITALLAVTGPGLLTADESTRHLPRVYSYFEDDKSCSELTGEATQAVNWNGRTWYLTAPMSLVSPPAETKRVGTPLEVRPLDVIVHQAQLRGAAVLDGNTNGKLATEMSIRLRLVLLVHDLTPLDLGVYSLQSIIAVRLCEADQNALVSSLYVGPRKGIDIKDQWHRNKSERWINGYRDAFSLAVADALDWAAAKITRR
jgi:hypothetical protein